LETSRSEGRRFGGTNKLEIISLFILPPCHIVQAACHAASFPANILKFLPRGKSFPPNILKVLPRGKSFTPNVFFTFCRVVSRQYF
jgi:hypothetical protein